MKIRSLSVQISAAVVLGLLSCGISNGRAASATDAPSFQQVSWEAVKLEKLQHAYHLLEHADADYHGHRVEAMNHIRKAAEVLGVEIKGKGHAEESQWSSDRKMQEAKHLLNELISEGGGKEQPHIHNAVKELDKALAIK